MSETPSLLLLAALAAPALAQAPSPRSATSREIEAKTQLESSLSARLEAVLRRLLGTDDVLAIVNAQMVSESERADVEVLPGVTVKETPEAPAPLEVSSALVRRVAVTLLLDRTLPEADAALARRTAESMAGLKEARGDRLDVQRIDFHRASAAGRFADRFLNPAGASLLLWLLAALWGLVFVSRRFFVPLVQVLRDAAAQLQTAAQARAEPASEAPDGAPAPGLPSAPTPTTAGADACGRRPPFSFVQERDLPALLLLLRQQSDSAAAVIVHYLPPALSCAALASLTPQRREQVVALMSSPVLLDPDDVKRIEEDILSKIDYIMGGEDKLAAILDQAPAAMQEEILALARRRDPALADGLERRVVVLADVGRLDEAGLASLNRQVPVRSMAAVLRSCPELMEKVLPKLKTGLGEWLKQEIDLIGDLPPAAAAAEQQRVLRALSRLVREGKVAVRKSVPVSALDGAAASVADARS